MQQCYVCGGYCGSTGEHDHFPTPARAGGDVVMPICRSCHDLKDRVLLADWDPSEAFEMFTGLWSKADRRERLLLVKMFHIMSR
jgi:hypothetical protein